MNPQHTFVAERAAAQHCAELIKRGPEPVDLIPALGRLGERIAKALGPQLSQLVASDAPDIQAGAPTEMSETELAELLGPLAANCLLACGQPGATVLAAIDGQAVLRLVDRAFGGKGEIAGPLPEAFPLSAELLVRRLETAIAAALGAGLGHAEVRCLRSAARLDELTPFPAGAKLAVVTIELREPGKTTWQLYLAIPQSQLGKLLGGGDPALRCDRSHVAAGDPGAAPFGDVALQISARLVDMQMSLSVLSALEPGSILPVAVKRAVPLDIAGTIIAHGTIGTADDRIAVRLTQLAG